MRPVTNEMYLLAEITGSKLLSAKLNKNFKAGGINMKYAKRQPAINEIEQRSKKEIVYLFSPPSMAGEMNAQT